MYTGWPQAERSDYRVGLLVKFRLRGGPGSPIVTGCRWTWACLAEKGALAPVGLACCI